MQARARVKYLRMSPKKMRQVAQLIKGKPVEEALNILNYMPKTAAFHLAKTLKSAAANAISGVGTAKLKAEDLSITKILVDAAPTAKRVRFQSMGRVFRIRKRYCHLTVEVEGTPAKDEPKTARGRKPRARKEAARDTGAGQAAEKKTAKKRAAKARTKKADAPGATPKTKKAASSAKDKKENNISAGDKMTAAGKKAADSQNEGSAPETQEE